MARSLLRYARIERRSPPVPALFLDRDGVLNEQVAGGYVTSPAGVRLLPVALEAVRAANARGTPVVVVTNQGMLARGLADEADLLEVHAALIRLLGSAGARVDAWYACPHHPLAPVPDDRHCACRKPRPGLLQAAAADIGIDLSRSVLVGDQESDWAAAHTAGLAGVVIVSAGDDPRAVAGLVAAAADDARVVATKGSDTSA